MSVAHGPILSVGFPHPLAMTRCRLDEFRPSREPGIHFGLELRSGAWRARFLRAIDILKLFFTTQVIELICLNTNKYAWMMILEKSTYSEPDGSWKEITPPPPPLSGTEHQPQRTEKAFNCKKCYRDRKIEQKQSCTAKLTMCICASPAGTALLSGMPSRNNCTASRKVLLEIFY